MRHGKGQPLRHKLGVDADNPFVRRSGDLPCDWVAREPGFEAPRQKRVMTGFDPLRSLALRIIVCE